MEDSEIRNTRHRESVLNWLVYDGTMDTLLFLLRTYGHLSEIQIARLFEITLKDQPNLDEDVLMILQNLNYLVEELQDAIGEELEEVNEENFRLFILQTLDRI